MKISFRKYPADIILCMLWSLILLPIALLDIEGIIRVVLGLPFILFIPGYILVFSLFPAKKIDKGIDSIERIALSLGLSIAIVPLIGFVLNYTPWGIRLESILTSIFIFIICVGSIGIYRWFKTNPDERFIISLNISLSKSDSNLNKALTIILIASIIIAAASLIYVVINPKTGEQFTEFYILSSQGTAEGFTRYINVGENVEGIIGIVNHEFKTVNYKIEIWLLNQTIAYNETMQENITTIHNLWFLDKIKTSLEHIPADIEESWTSQWEENFSVTINRNGSFKIEFLLFTKPTETYTINRDYKDIAEEKLESAYRELYLWIDVP